MSAWFAIPLAALAAAGPQGRLAVLDLYERGFHAGYVDTPFSERELSASWGVDRKVVVRILDSLSRVGCVSVTRTSPGKSASSTFRVRRPVRDQATNQATNHSEEDSTPESDNPEPSAEPSHEPFTPTRSSETRDRGLPREEERREVSKTDVLVEDEATPHEAPVDRGLDRTSPTPARKPPDLGPGREATTSLEGEQASQEGEQAEIGFPLRLVAPKSSEPKAPPPTRLSEMTSSALKAAGISGSKGLTSLTRKALLEIPGIGPKRADEVEAWLEGHGLQLASPPLEGARVVQICAEIWTELWSEGRMGKYPWELAGADRARLQTWASAVELQTDPLEGERRLRGGIRAYLAAVDRGIAWPANAAPTTKAFTVDLANWLQKGEQTAASTPFVGKHAHDPDPPKTTTPEEQAENDKILEEMKARTEARRAEAEARLAKRVANSRRGL